jgi:glycosyltransferase involved in cell wall biosynthesis
LVDVDDWTAPRFLDDRAVAACVLQADLLLAPVRGATQSSSVVLALAAGVPILAYDEGELRSLVDDRGLVKSGDASAMARRIEETASGAVAGGPRLSRAEWQERCAKDWDAVLTGSSTEDA